MSGAPSPVPLLPPPDLETTVQQLRHANDELQRRRADAEKDRELFRDLYNKASAHAGEVTAENTLLQERAERAEQRLADGLAMVRATFDTRVRALEAENAQLAGLNRILVAKDVRTHGDDIRRRAAEQEGLAVENQTLRAELAELRLDYRRMERLLEQLGEKELEQLSEQEEEIKQKLETPTPSDTLPASTKIETVVKTETVITQ
uniref:Uncharacterized protein n=1 Tax=Phanerochaete sordida TaxID=48140 RepID=A0A9P3GTF2_9APHY|nr:hypothetical protein PsYK624_156030 [Phanerochaete sordida]